MGKGGIHEVVWMGSNPLGMEHCTVRREGGGWTLSGTVVRHFREDALGLSYRIKTDLVWRTKAVLVEELFHGSRLKVELATKRGVWSVNGRRATALEGCTDVDLEASPVTNTLPLKRTGLKVGAKVELIAAWVRFPSLRVLPMRQSYERVGANKYVYRSSSGFTSEIEVDDFGLVRRYGDYWVAV